MTVPPTRRCAIYTRKSTEEGLEQEFNTLDAQREACAAYILSQAGEGWSALPDMYSDGGYSGGNMQRPALKQLLSDIEAGRIDTVVVYKVDRLTRSLTDFARMVETFDAREVSFVSVTQAFNTTTSMGRLTLNVLLSFAQFEREVTGERIRDKIAASKARGMWMDGNLPLGYDAEDRHLRINEPEAEKVRQIFELYLQIGSIPTVAQRLDALGIRSKRWTSCNGNTHGGVRMRPGAVAHILNNRIYLGEIVHKGKAFRGDHEAIIGRDLFNRVQTKLSGNRQVRRKKLTRAARSVLIGRVFDALGNPMRPTFGYGRGSKMYRYYTSHTLLPDAPRGRNAAGQRVSAEALERLVSQRLQDVMLPDRDILTQLKRLDVADETLAIVVATDDIRRPNEDDTLMRARIYSKHMLAPPTMSDEGVVFRLCAKALKRGQTIGSSLGTDEAGERAELVRLLRASHEKLLQLNASPLFPDRHVDATPPANRWSKVRIPIGFLAPDIQRAILKGEAGKGISSEMLLAANIPLAWEDQHAVLAAQLM